MEQAHPDSAHQVRLIFLSRHRAENFLRAKLASKINTGGATATITNALPILAQLRSWEYLSISVRVIARKTVEYRGHPPLKNQCEATLDLWPSTSRAHNHFFLRYLWFEDILALAQ